MPKPRRKVLRKPGKPTPANPEIQKVLDMQAERKRYNNWAEADAEGDGWDVVNCQGESGDGCSGVCGDPNCKNYSVLADRYFHVPAYTVMISGLPMDASSACWPISVTDGLTKPFLTATGRILAAPKEAFPVSATQILAAFDSSVYFSVLRSRIIRCGQGIFRVLPMPVTSRELYDRLDQIDRADDVELPGEDLNDPFMGAALVPGLRRSDFTRAIDFQGLRAYQVSDGILESLAYDRQKVLEEATNAYRACMNGLRNTRGQRKTAAAAFAQVS